jgi:hypothetical protein
VIAIRVELWPGGDQKRARLLALGTIENTGGTAARGAYKALLYGATAAGVTKALLNRAPFRAVGVENFPRKRLCAWDLLFRVLRAAVGERNASTGESAVGASGPEEAARRSSPQPTGDGTGSRKARGRNCEEVATLAAADSPVPVQARDCGPEFP